MRKNLILSTMLAIGGMIFVVPVYSSAEGENWQTQAKWHRTVKRAEPGTLLLDAAGVEFRSPKFNRRWKYVDIHTFDLSRRELTLLTYENRRWHEPGERPFRFTLSTPMPAEVAAQFTYRVGKPVRNGEPLPASSAIGEIPAHHRVWSGGSNGTLRFTNDGVDYITGNGRDSRTWRWADIQALANPNPYELRVTAFREIAEFDLKRPLSRELFERMWDHLYADGLNLSAGHGDVHEEIHQ